MPCTLAPVLTVAGLNGVSVPVSGLREYCEMVAELALAAYTLLPSGLMVRPMGPVSAPTVAGFRGVSVPVSVLREYCETLFEKRFATYTFLPSGLTRMP